MIRKKEDHGGKPVLDLTGPDGNAYALLAYAKRYAKDLGMMDKWKDVEIDYDFWDIPPSKAKTLKDQVHWRIWQKATHGDNKCIEILAQLGCLDD